MSQSKLFFMSLRYRIPIHGIGSVQPACTEDVPPASPLISKKEQRNTKKAAFLLPDTNRIHFQFRNAFGYESKQAFQSNPGAFPCIDLSEILVLSPIDFASTAESSNSTGTNVTKL